MPQYPAFTLAGYGMGQPDAPTGAPPPPTVTLTQPTVGTLTATNGEPPTRGLQRRAAPGGRFEIGGFNVRDPETIDDPALRELAIQYRDAQAQGLPTDELRRQLAARVATILRERSSEELWNPTDLALWGAGGAGAGWLGSKVFGWKTQKTMVWFGLLGMGARVIKALPAYAGGRLAAAVIGGAASAETTPEVQAAENGVTGYWR